MTDKEKIREEVKRKLDVMQYQVHRKDAYKELKSILDYIDSLQEEPVSSDFEMALAEMVDKAQRCVVEPWVVAAQWKDCLIELAKSEEPVSIWHDASEEPDDMSHCLIFYGCKESVGRYLHYEPVLYNKKEKVFITPSFPHPTGYKVEQKSFDGGCVAEVYKNRRDRISISDITQWCYLYDLHKLSNIEKTEKCGKEEPVSEDLGEYINELSKQFPEVSFAKLSRIAVRVAKWKEEQMMEKAIDVEVKVDAGGYPYIPQMELYDYDKDVPLAKAGDRYKVILIKEE